MRDSWIKRLAVLSIAAGILTGVSWAHALTEGSAASGLARVADAAPLADVDEEYGLCIVHTIATLAPLVTFCELTPDQLATNANAHLYLVKLVTLCSGATVGFTEKASHKVFRWELVPGNGEANPVDNVRLELTSENGQKYIWPVAPGFHTPGIDADANMAELDMMELDAIGGENWNWRLVDFYRSHLVEQWHDGEGDEHHLWTSKTCSFTIDKAELPPSPPSQIITDNQTQSFPGAAPELKALSPCGSTVSITSQDPNETFVYLTDLSYGVIIEFSKTGATSWGHKPHANNPGVKPPGDDRKVIINVDALLAEGEDDWQWRITDPYNTASHGNACAFKIQKESPPPPPPSGNTGGSSNQSGNSGVSGVPQGYKQQASYSGNCAARTAGTVCLGFSDGFVWLINDAITGQQDRGTFEGKTIRVAEGRKAYYFHILGTTWVRELPK